MGTFSARSNLLSLCIFILSIIFFIGIFILPEGFVKCGLKIVPQSDAVLIYSPGAMHAGIGQVLYIFVTLILL